MGEVLVGNGAETAAVASRGKRHEGGGLTRPDPTRPVVFKRRTYK